MDDVRGDFLGPPNGTTPAAVIANNLTITNLVIPFFMLRDRNCVLFEPFARFHILILGRITEWPRLSMYKYIIVNLVFPTSVFGVGISF